MAATWIISNLQPNIIVGYPPNYGEIVQALPAVADTPNGIFAHYPDIYNPGGAILPSFKLAHEQVHLDQQKEVGTEWWWQMFLSDPLFRLNEEMMAYQADFKAFCAIYKDRNQRFSYLQNIAQDLSNEAYGSIISYTDAMKRIKE